MANKKSKKNKTKTKVTLKAKSKVLDTTIDVNIKEKLKKFCDKLYADTKILKDELSKSLNNPSADIVQSLLVKKSAAMGLLLDNQNNLNNDFETSRITPKLQLNKLEKMIKGLKHTKKNSVYTDSIMNCSSSMNSAVLNYWQSPMTILRAVNDCIYQRKWDNLIRLLLILIQHAHIYRPVIRHACQIMDQMNPFIEEIGVKNHVHMIKKFTGKSDNSNI